MHWQVIGGDVREKLAELAPASVQCVVTSPPYFGLRDYLTAKWEGGDPACDHAPERRGSRFATAVSSKQASNAGSGSASRRDCDCGAQRIDHQIGLEGTPAAYVEALVAVFAEVRRVLKDDGTVWLNLGDSYASDTKGTGGIKSLSGGGTLRPNGRSQPQMAAQRMDYGILPIKAKDLVGIPWRVAFALQAAGWYLRSDIIWSKPNPMPESVTDRPTKAHEYLFLLSKRERYYYDADAIRETLTSWEVDTDGQWRCLDGGGGAGIKQKVATQHPGMMGKTLSGNMAPGKRIVPNAAGRNKRSVWTIPTQPYPDAHFATFPEALVEPCILAGTSEKGQCPTCGRAWERVTERDPVEQCGVTPKQSQYRDQGLASSKSTIGRTKAWSADEGHTRTLGWQPGCTCNAGDPVPQLVLDPFAGSGTVGAVAVRHQRNFVGIELNPAYVELARTRIGNVAPLLAQEIVA